MKISKQALIALGIASVGLAGCTTSKPNTSDENLTREQLDKMLEKKAKKPPKSRRDIMAMCYAMVWEPSEK